MLENDKTSGGWRGSLAVLPGAATVLLLFACLFEHPGVTAPTPAWTILGGSLLAIVCALLLAIFRVTSKLVVASSIALILWCLVSTTQSLAPYLSTVFDVSMVGFVGIIAAVQISVSRRRHWFQVATGLVIASSCISAWGLISLLQKGGRLQATFTNPDCFSLIPLVGAILSLGLASASPSNKRLIWLIATTFLCVSVVATGCRAGMLGLCVGYLAFLITLGASEDAPGASKSSGEVRASIPIFLIPPILTIVVLFSVGSGLASLDKWLLLASGGDKLNIKSRMDVVTYGAHTFLRRPLLGAGPGCFHLAYEQDRPLDNTGDDYMNEAHDDHFQWLIETGAIGMVLWLFLLGVSVRRAWTSFECPAGIVGASIGSVLGIGAYQLLNFAVPVVADLYWLAACIGLTCSCSFALTRSKPRAGPGPFEIGIGIVLLGLGVWASFTSWKLVQNSSDIAAALKLKQDLKWDEAYARLKPARERFPLDARLALASATLADKMFFFTNKTIWLDQEKEDYRAAYGGSPRDLEILTQYADFLERMKLHKEAAVVLKEARDDAPYHHGIRLAQVKNKIFQSDVDGAAQEILGLGSARQGVEPKVLVTLIAAVEVEESGKGVQMIKELLAKQRPDGLQAGIDAAALAQKAGKSKAAADLASVVEASKPDRLTQLFALSEIEGKAGHTKIQSALIDKVRKSEFTAQEDQEAFHHAWQSWALLNQESSPKVVAGQLELYLIKFPRENWARSLLSRILDSQGMLSEARAALRNGLAFDNDGSLRIELGDLYRSHSQNEIAKGYYEDALPLVKDTAAVQQRIDALQTTNAPEVSPAVHASPEPSL